MSPAKYTKGAGQQRLLLLAAAATFLLQIAGPAAGVAVDRLLCNAFVHRGIDNVAITASDAVTGDSYSVVFQTDCNLCAYYTDSTGAPTAYWCWTNVTPASCGGLYFTCNGNLQVYFADLITVAWQSGSAQLGALQPWELRLNADGSLGIYSLADPNPIWFKAYNSTGVQIG